MKNKHVAIGKIYQDEVISNIAINGKVYKLPKEIILTAKDQEYCLRDEKESVLAMILLKLLCEEDGDV